MKLFLFLFLLPSLIFAYDDKVGYFVENDPWTKTSSKVDLVIFSFDRPMQLYALLESSDRYFTGLNSIHVIYRSSNDEFSAAYDIVKLKFPFAYYYKQSAKKDGSDFKKLLLDAAFGKKAKARYIMFAVDDMIVTNFVDLKACVSAMRKQRPWFFSLRLGKNIHLDTVLNIPSPPPKRKSLGKQMFSWKFSNGKGAWNYPNTVDMTIYRKKDVRDFLKEGRYTNPNTLEGAWSLQPCKRKTGLAFNSSKAVNIPLNVVNPYWTSSHMQISPHELLERFKKWEKIDINALYKLKPYATHMPVSLSFVKRKDPKKHTEFQLSHPFYFLKQSH